MKDYKIKLFTNKGLIFCALITTVFLAILNVFKGISISLIINSATGDTNISLLLATIIGLSVAILDPVANGICTYFKSKISQKHNETLKANLIEHIESISLDDYSKYHSGEFLTRINQDSESVSSIVPEVFIDLMQSILLTLSATGYLLFVNYKMALIIMFFIIPISLWGKYAMPKLQGVYKIRQEKESSLRIYIQEQIQNATFIKSFGLIKDSKEGFIKENKEKARLVIKSDIMNHIAWGGGNILGTIAFILCISLGSYFVIKNEMSIGSVVGFSQIMSSVLYSATYIMGIIALSQSKLSSKKRVEEIFNIPKEEIKEIDKNTILHKNLINKDNNKVLKVENVKFYYHEDKIILNNFNVNFEKGKLIGIIGESGCGKSTLVKLLLGLYLPQQGKITINCEEEVLSGKEIREYISYVPQNNFLMSGTIRENILKGNKEATEEQLNEVIKRAHLSDVIKNLPNGLDTMLGEGGIGISLGQAQRVAIARALIRNKPILILDEPTASLDIESEKIVLQTIKEISKDYVCIMVAHGELAHSYCDEKILLKK